MFLYIVGQNVIMGYIYLVIWMLGDILLVPKRFRTHLSFSDAVLLTKFYIGHYPTRRLKRYVDNLDRNVVRELYLISREFIELFNGDECVDFRSVIDSIEKFLRNRARNIYSIDSLDEIINSGRPLLDMLLDDKTSLDTRLHIVDIICMQFGEGELLNFKNSKIFRVIVDVMKLKLGMIGFTENNPIHIADTLFDRLNESYKHAVGLKYEDLCLLREILKSADRPIWLGIELLTSRISELKNMKNKERIILEAKKRIIAKARKLSLELDIDDSFDKLREKIINQLRIKIKVRVVNKYFNKNVQIPLDNIEVEKNELIWSIVEWIFSSDDDEDNVPSLVLRVDPKPFETYCPLCKDFVDGSDYLYDEAFPDDYYAYWVANLVKHYRHEHISYYNRTMRSWSYAERNPEYMKLGYEEYKKLVNNRAKRQIIRAILKDEKLTTKCKKELIRAILKLKYNDNKTIELINKALKRLGNRK